MMFVNYHFHPIIIILIINHFAHVDISIIIKLNVSENPICKQMKMNLASTISYTYLLSHLSSYFLIFVVKPTKTKKPKSI